MKRAVKEHPLTMTDILKNENVSPKKASWKRVYAGTNEIFKGGIVLVTTVQSLRILCTTSCYYLYHLISLKIYGIF